MGHQVGIQSVLSATDTVMRISRVRSYPPVATLHNCSSSDAINLYLVHLEISILVEVIGLSPGRVLRQIGGCLELTCLGLLGLL